MASAATDPAAATVTHGAPPLRSHPSFVYDSTKVTQSGTPPHMEFWYPGVRGTADKIRLLIAEATSQRRITCALVVRDIKEYMQTTAGNAATFPGIVPRLRLHKHKQDSGAGVKKVAVSEVYHVEPVFAAIAAAAGLAGSTDDERALVSMLSAECEYIREALFAQPFYRDTKLSEFKAKEAQMAWCDEFLLPELSALTKVLGTNTFFLGDEISAADVAVFSILSIVAQEIDFVLPCFPLLNAFFDRVGARTAIVNCKRYM